MTVLKFNPLFPAVANDFDEAVNTFFNRPVGSFFKDEVPFNVPAVNVSEDSKGYYVSLAIPGLDKEDIAVEVDKGVLTISADKQSEEQEETKEVTRQEFSYLKFKRSFNLPEEVAEKNIDAEYLNGVLEIALPKKEAKLLAAKKIAIK